RVGRRVEVAGLLGLTAETPDQVRPMIEQALRHEGPALVEAVVSRQELSIPPTITAAEAKGFTLFLLKAVLSGRGDEIVDLAKVNLFRWEHLVQERRSAQGVTGASSRCLKIHAAHSRVPKFQQLPSFQQVTLENIGGWAWPHICSPEGRLV